ncbi:solute carrier family 12 member 9 isoform X2 [Anthonomus grandis grandis]|uniref:solute carrier family 12 member 9 isoform X2 n=1 Tax=Anthonomus grandis grandis TaxID=2921223 RepID=UPI0021667F6A|nr:solute carrier family 12 member 9 isoform X2 [Anthonomus grandis grandis]
MLAPEESSVNNVDKAPLVGGPGSSMIRKISGIFHKNQQSSTSASGSSYVRFNSFTDESNTRTLGSFAGVFAPVTLSMFSALIFLRMGYLVGNAGLLVTLLQLVIAYAILYFTVSSVCAISTNGAVEGGGAYFMISRTLGPEFGGSIGTLFFLANIVSSALCISGCIEGLVANLGPSGYFSKNIVQGSRWWEFLYCSILNIANLIICLIGASMFAKTTVFVLAIVCICLAITFFSFFYQPTQEVPIPSINTLCPNITNFTYTGLNTTTLHDNLFSHYGRDYTTPNGETVTFATVFGVLFSGVTGIMAGANMSGELKSPGKSIPKGTLSAVTFTLCVYLTMSLLTASTATSDLMRNNYLYLEKVSVFPASVAIGLFTATWSAALSNVIGGSRVLEALAKDRIFGYVLDFITKGTWKGNPVAAVLVSAFLVQLVLLIGSLNLIAQLNAVLFLLSYLATNLACLGLELAGAPNFRPSFAYFTWHTALIGLIGTLVMMFVINAIYAACSIAACMFLVICLHLFSPSKGADWGSISQALIFHQVRKYLLLLDSRKDHVKFWRPQILLLVNSPRSACPLIDFVNDLKKGGLYVLGHVVREESHEGPDPTIDMVPHWLNLVDHLKVKAFIELTVAKTVREGLLHLMRLSGMGAMKPNTVIFGFLDDQETSDFLIQPDSSYQNLDFDNNVFPLTEVNSVEPLEYVQMMRDVLRMNKNLCLCRNFAKLNKDQQIVKSKLYIDVWPVNFLNPGERDAFDITSLFTMQLACIVNMVPLWSRLKLRICFCDETRVGLFHINSAGQSHINKLETMLKKLRIDAEIFLVTQWGSVIESHGSNMTTVNSLILDRSTETAVTFIYLPAPPQDDDHAVLYYNNLEVISRNLPPTIFVHGVSTVTSTTL